MTVTEKLGALGSWSVRLSDHTPEEVKASLDYFGHVALIRGRVNPADHGDTLLRAARYVGVLRRRQGDLESELSGSGMVFWLGDEDDKGQVIENKVTLTDATLAEAVAAVLPDSVQLGQILATPAGTYTGTHQWQTPRQALQVICDAFGVEFRVNGDATVDIGTQAQLYATTPSSIIVRKGAGSDLDLSALSGRFDPDTSVIDYSTRVVLLGRTQDNGAIATGSAELVEVPYVDLHGNPVRMTRLISESDQTEGSVAARSQLQLNRFARTARSLKVTAERYETDGTFLVGDNAWVYDPDTGIVSPDHEVTFRGQVLHPDVVRIAGITWPVSEDHTVAFRTQAGEWIDLTRWVVWETGDNELVLGDLPRSLLGDGGNPILDRVEVPRDTIAPGVPTGLTLSTFTATSADGHEAGFIAATWTAPTVNEDGSVVTDLSHYLVAWKWSPGLQWQYATVAATEATLTATPGLPYDVFVGAYDRSNNFSGWSPVETITVAPDSTAPLAPSDPGVGNYLGQLRVVWDGLMADGSAPPADFSRVDVHVGTASGFTPTESNRVASLSASGVAYATADYGVTVWARLVAYDHTGNASTPSGSVSGSTAQVVSADVFDGAIGTAKLADLAVVTAKIDDLAVNDAKIGDVSAGKITAGVVDAEVIIGTGTVLSGDPLGQRVEMAGGALRGWANDTTQTFVLDGISNLLTGTTQTALTGRRIVIGAAGSTGEMQFFAPDGTMSQIRAWTEPGGVEAVQFGIPVTDSLWNRINYNHSAAGEYASYRSGTHEFIFDTSAATLDLQGNPNGGRFVVFESDDRGATPATTRFDIDVDATRLFYAGQLRFWLDASVSGFIYPNGTTALSLTNTELNVWGNNGGHRMRLGANDVLLSSPDAGGTQRGRLWIDTGATRFYQGNPDTTGIMEFVPGAQVGGASGWLNTERIKFTTPRINGTGGVYTALFQYTVNVDGTNHGFECRLGDDSAFVPVKASAFTVNSDARSKSDVATADLDAWGLLRGTPVRSYRRGGPTEIGLLAQEAPAQIVTPSPSGELGVDLYQYTALLHLAVQQAVAGIEARLDNLEDAA